MKKAPRHPAEVTVDRLNDHLLRWGDKLTQDERDAFWKVQHVLGLIWDGER